MNKYNDNRTLLMIGNRFNSDSYMTDMQKACEKIEVRMPAQLAVYQVNSARNLAVYEGALAPITASCTSASCPPACWPYTRFSASLLAVYDWGELIPPRECYR